MTVGFPIHFKITFVLYQWSNRSGHAYNFILMTAQFIFVHCSCINGLIEAKVSNALATEKPVNFDEWILRY